MFLMKKEGWLLVIVVGLFFGVLIGMNTSFYITGMVVGNTSIGNVNSAPVCSTIPNQSWVMNTQKVLDLSGYCSDTESQALVYNATDVSDVTISIVNGVVTFTSATDFVGTRIVTFSVFDYVNKVYTNNITLLVNSTTTEESTSDGGSSARVITEAEGEKVLLYLAPVVEHEESKVYYLRDYLVNDIALIENVDAVSMIYLKDSAYVQVAMIEDGKILVNFVNENGKLLQLEFFENDWFELDEDGDGLSDYVLYAENVGDDVDLRFVAVRKVSFGMYSFVKNYGLIIGLSMLILVLLVLILKKKV
jgi:hypothetical protein